MLRTPVLAGRAFESQDTQDGQLVAIVNDAFVTQYLKGNDPIGESVWLGRTKGGSAEIVNVVAEIRDDNDPRTGYPQIYVPFAQEPSADACLILRSQGNRRPSRSISCPKLGAESPPWIRDSRCSTQRRSTTA